jgi:hypothetical protein
LGPPEWPAILGNYVNTAVFGVITSSHMTDVDNPFTHEMIFDCSTKVDCPSDWEFRVTPIGPQQSTAPQPSLFTPSNKTDIKIEYEAYYARAADVTLDWPQAGDLVFTAGRWIIDCGHDTYHSELHPIFMRAKMKTEAYDGQKATRADIWVNGWFPGDTLEFDVFPPPRPSPDAQLVLIKPFDADAALGLGVEFAWEPPGLIIPNRVHVKFSAPLRQNTVSDAGEMFFEPLRDYTGKWFLYWAPK